MTGTCVLEPELVADWYSHHRAKNPMNPKDPDDIAIGWVYVVVSHCRLSKNQDRPRSHTEEMVVLDYESTLNDARATLESRAREYERRHSMCYRRTSSNRFYSFDGEVFHTLTIVALEDDDPEYLSRHFL